MIMPSCQKKGQIVNHVLDATATQQPNQINIWSRQLLLGNQIKRGTAMGVRATTMGRLFRGAREKILAVLPFPMQFLGGFSALTQK
jgi:hypothetical protein